MQVRENCCGDIRYLEMFLIDGVDYSNGFNDDVVELTSITLSTSILIDNFRTNYLQTSVSFPLCVLL